MAVEWREDLATGNLEIDDQHKELFRRFNILLDSCRQGKGKDEVCRLLLFLGDYVRSHFAAEEQLQIRHTYPGFRAHKEQHDKFIDDFRKLEDQLRTEGATFVLVIQTNQTLVDWLIRHISGTDKELANYLHTTG
jgi:hemerythrin